MQSNFAYPSSTPVAGAYLFVSVQLKWLKDNNQSEWLSDCRHLHIIHISTFLLYFADKIRNWLLIFLFFSRILGKLIVFLSFFSLLLKTWPWIRGNVWKGQSTAVCCLLPIPSISAPLDRTGHATLISRGALKKISLPVPGDHLYISGYLPDGEGGGDQRKVLLTERSLIFLSISFWHLNQTHPAANRFLWELNFWTPAGILPCHDTLKHMY